MGAAKASRLSSVTRPGFAVYDQPVRIGHQTLAPGVYYHGQRGQTPSDDWLASPVRVTAQVVNCDDGSHGRQIHYTTTEGKLGEWFMPMELLAGNGTEIRRELLRRGVRISTDNRCRDLFSRYLNQVPEMKIATTSCIGWQKGNVFVLPSGTIGESSPLSYSGEGAKLFTYTGNLQTWQSRVASLCIGNPILLLSISIAFAGPLLRILSINGGGVHLVGSSSSGKTLSQLVAASVWGSPAAQGFVSTWDASRGGIETVATERSDTLLILDEISRVRPDDVEAIVYALSNGQGRATMTRERSANRVLAWRLLLLSSGEKSLADHAGLNGRATNAGAELRMVDLLADRKYGVFDDLHGRANGEELHRDLTRAVHSDFGLAGPKFVDQLIRTNTSDIHKQFNQHRAAFFAPNSQASRVADRFALIACAGELAAAQGLVPWPTGAAIESATQLYNGWLQAQGPAISETRRALRSISNFLDSHSSRFTDIRDILEIPRRAGYTQQTGNRKLFLFNRPSLSEACPDLGVEQVIRLLEKSGAIVSHDRGRLTKKTRIGGRLLNLYVIDPEKLS